LPGRLVQPLQVPLVTSLIVGTPVAQLLGPPEPAQLVEQAILVG